jgi:hypothetical protein
MTEQISLDAQALEAALGILHREQAAYLPTRRERALYRAFNVSAFSMVLVSALFLFLTIDLEEKVFSLILGLLFIVGGLVSLATLVLLILNIGLIHKLYRHAQLRRRLRLAFYFAPVFSAERRQKRVVNALTMLITVVGVLFSLVGLLLLGVSVWAISKAPELWTAVFLGFSLALLGGGLGLACLHFVRRGKQRLDLVLRLERTLATQAADPSQAGGAKVSTDEYHAIAGLERTQIIRDRASSIVSGRQEKAAEGYLCQTSRQMQEAKHRLPPELRAKVESEIARLLADPTPASAPADPVTGARRIPVAGTSLAIEFDVDPNRHLVRLYELDGTPANRS